MGDRFQGRHAFGSALSAQMKSRLPRRADFDPLYAFQFMMTVMNFARLPPGAVGNDELNGRSVLSHQRPIEFDGIVGRVEQKRPIIGSQKVFKVERFIRFTSDAHLAIDQRPEREQAGIAAACEFPVMNDQADPGPQLDSRQRIAQALRARRGANRAWIGDFTGAGQLEVSKQTARYSCV